jgi:hypothetical protein
MFTDGKTVQCKAIVSLDGSPTLKDHQTHRGLEQIAYAVAKALEAEGVFQVDEEEAYEFHVTISNAPDGWEEKVQE